MNLLVLQAQTLVNPARIGKEPPLKVGDEIYVEWYVMTTIYKASYAQA
jgi:hypothetical protein